MLTASEYGRGRPERHPLPFRFSCNGNEMKLDDCIIGSLTFCSSGIVAIECSNGMYFNNKMKNRKYHTLQQFQNSIENIIEGGKIDTPNTQRYISDNFPGLVQALQ